MIHPENAKFVIVLVLLVLIKDKMLVQAVMLEDIYTLLHQATSLSNYLLVPKKVVLLQVH